MLTTVRFHYRHACVYTAHTHTVLAIGVCSIIIGNIALRIISSGSAMHRRRRGDLLSSRMCNFREKIFYVENNDRTKAIILFRGGRVCFYMATVYTERSGFTLFRGHRRSGSRSESMYVTHFWTTHVRARLTNRAVDARVTAIDNTFPTVTIAVTGCCR